MTDSATRLTADQFIEKMNLAVEFYALMNEKSCELELKFVDDHGNETHYLGPRLNTMNHESYLAFLRKVDELAGTHTVAGTYLKTMNKVGKSHKPTRLTADEFIAKIDQAPVYAIIMNEVLQEMELLVRDETNEVRGYLGPDPDKTAPDDLIAFLEKLEARVKQDADIDKAF
jgi:hypothetical protein